MRKTLHFIDENLEEVIMILLLIAMTAIMGIQIFSRYVLRMSLSWSEEITRYLFIWSAFMSVSLCTRKCISIKIDQFIKFFPRRGEAFFKVLNLTVSFVLFAFLIPYSAYYLKATIESGQVSPACGIPMYYVQSAPLVCFTLTAIRTVQRWVINLRIVLGKDQEFPPEGNLAESITETVADQTERGGE